MRMKHRGKARKAGTKLILITLGLVLIVAVGAALVAASILKLAVSIIVILWLLFSIFAVSFFRDPTPTVPGEKNVVVSPAHGTVDVIDEIEEKQFMGGRCKRVSIFLSVFDVHVQNAPVAGQVVFLKHTSGQFVNAMRTDSALHNENVLVGFNLTDRPGEKVSVRLIAGLIARRIIPWVVMNDVVEKGERIALIQFGSRADIYLPLNATIQVKLRDKVVGGQSIVALLG
ncbi:MAG: putative phosphatidylserine decarboxylase [Verrucomicrobiales bacterium]|nr:putative phosphatidylserine decarboxylase [Verrucomicrobiales bacterium]